MSGNQSSDPKSLSPQIIKLPNRILEKIGGLEAAKKAFGADVLDRLQRAIDGQADEFEGVIDTYVQDLNVVTCDAALFDGAAIAKAQDICHELRGISGTFGFHLVSRVANSLFDFLEEYGALKTDDKTTIYNIVRMHVDTLSAAKSTGMGGEELAAQVEQGLLSVVAKFKAAV